MSKDEADAAGNGRSRKTGTKPVLDRQIQVHIGRKLKAVYDEVAAEPLPKEILDLLAKLEGRSTE
jgi:Anti-sigma factor NepR